VAVFDADEGERLERSRADVDATLARLAEVEHVAAVSDPFATGRLSDDGRMGVADITMDVPSGELGPGPASARRGARAGRTPG
jgi:RND superfamily putative drug exporter